MPFIKFVQYKTFPFNMQLVHKKYLYDVKVSNFQCESISIDIIKFIV